MARFRMWKRLSILVVVALLLSLYVVAVPAAETVAAETVIFSEDFEGGLPGDWYVYTAKGWGWLPGSGDARDGCAGTYMIADSYHNQTIDFQSIMYTPSFDCSSYGKVILEFDHDYSAMAGCYPYKADVEVYVGGSPTMVWRCQAGNPVSGHITVDISHVAAGQSDVKIRWWYFATAWNIFWQWEVDNVKVSAPPPDLVVEKEAQCYPDGTFIVGYTVTNDGGTAAGNSTTCKYLGGVLQETQPCPPLGPGQLCRGV